MNVQLCQVCDQTSCDNQRCADLLKSLNEELEISNIDELIQEIYGTK